MSKTDQVIKLRELISEVVGWQGMTWNEKRHKILYDSTPEESRDLEEFCSWFEPQPT